MSPIMKALLTKKAENILNLSTEEILKSYEDTSKCGDDTPSHVAETAKIMGIAVGAWNKSHPDEQINEDLACKAAYFHDIGKLLVPTEILNKPGRPTEAEYDTIKKHTTFGNDILTKMLGEKGISTGEQAVLLTAQKMALYHHERPDGKGYPFGITGENIPLEARIMAAVDVLQALTAKRTYKEAMPFEKAEAIMREGASTQFDPAIIKTLFDDPKIRDELKEAVGQKDVPAIDTDVR